VLGAHQVEEIRGRLLSARTWPERIAVLDRALRRPPARVIRFDRARRALARTPGSTLATVAIDHGFYDQSHLAHEFAAFAGCPPTTWLEQELRNLQAGRWTPPEYCVA
jgi:hypothetical protein